MHTTGTALVELLEAHGVEYVFGIPGNHTVELYRGLKQSRIAHITTRHEQGAAFMADGYARASGRPGVCFLITGPGLLNAATAIAQADQDSVPMLVISTVSDARPDSGALHQMRDQTRAVSGFVSRTVRVEQPEQLEETLHNAFEFFHTDRPGAFHIELPVSVAAAPLSLKKHFLPFVPPPPKKATGREIQEISQAIDECARPLIIAGGGAANAQDLGKLAELMDAPVLNTTNGKGTIPIEHSHAVGGSPSLPSVRTALAEADLVLALGTQFSETDYDLLMIGDAPRPSMLIDVNLNRAADAWLNVEADAPALVSALIDTLSPRTRGGRERAAAYRQAVAAEPHYHPDFAAFFSTLEAAMGDFVLVGDSTRPTYYATWMFERSAPRRYFHSVTGFGTLGYAIPAAFGASLGTHTPTVALIGDGGAQFTLTEIATAVDNRIGVPILVWQNDGYAEIGNSMSAAGVETSSTKISAPDFERLAAAYGAPACRPEDLTELSRELERARGRDTPTIIVIEEARFVSSPSGKWYG